MIEIISNIDESNIEQLPYGCKRIWDAICNVEIKRYHRKTFYSEQKSISIIFKDDEHENENAYFKSVVEKQLNLRERDDYKITSIEKIKYISYSIPQTQ